MDNGHGTRLEDPTAFSLATDYSVKINFLYDLGNFDDRLIQWTGIAKSK